MDISATTLLRSQRTATARRGSASSLGAPYRSESFAEDLLDTTPALTPRARRRGLVLLAVPLGLALLGSVAPILGGMA
jgi:hypothetical protein